MRKMKNIKMMKNLNIMGRLKKSKTNKTTSTIVWEVKNIIAGGRYLCTMENRIQSGYTAGPGKRE